MKNNVIFYSVRDLYEKLGFARTTAYELAARKDFPSFRIGRRIYIPKAAFERWLHEQTDKTLDDV